MVSVGHQLASCSLINSYVLEENICSRRVIFLSVNGNLSIATKKEMQVELV